MQDFFLSQSGEGIRSRIIANTGSFARLLAYFRIPIVVTLERPVNQKGSCPREIMKYLGNRAELFEKNFFDLTKERQIRDHLEHLKRTQILVAGCSTRRNRPTGCVIRSVGWREHGSIWRFNGRWWLCPLIESTREKIQPCQGESQQLQKDQVAFYEAERHCMSGRANRRVPSAVRTRINGRVLCQTHRSS